MPSSAAASGSSFYYAFRFLPPPRRAAITAFYAFCREVDDVVDGRERLAAEPGAVAGDHERGDAAGSGVRRRAGEDGVDVGVRRVGDPGLLATQAPAVAVGLDALDRLLYDLLYTHLDDEAVTGGAPAYSLFAQHMSGWYADNRKWIDALYTTWRKDSELGDTNDALLTEHGRAAVDAALEAVTPFAARIDENRPSVRPPAASTSAAISSR